jgi:hypothetical protein
MKQSKFVNTKTTNQLINQPNWPYFSAQLEVHHDDADDGNGDDKDDENQKEESKEIVVLLQPDGVHQEEKLDEESSEGEDPRHQGGDGRTQVPYLVRNLSWNLICSNWVVVRLQKWTNANYQSEK